MKYIALFIVPFMLILGACGDNDEDKSHPFLKESTAPVVEDDDDIFIDVIRDEIPHAKYSTDEEIVELGHSVCDALNVVDIADLLEVVVDSGFDAYEGGFIVGASVTMYCPEHQRKIDDFIDNPTSRV